MLKTWENGETADFLKQNPNFLSSSMSYTPQPTIYIAFKFINKRLTKNTKINKKMKILQLEERN